MAPARKAPEDALQAEPLGQRDERHQQQDGEADPDLGGGVLQPDEHLAQPHRPGRAGHHEAGDGHQPGERAEQDDLRAGAPA